MPLGKAIEIEERIMELYSKAVEQSKPLMADVPGNFVIVVQKRNHRIQKLKSLVEEGGW